MFNFLPTNVRKLMPTILLLCLLLIAGATDLLGPHLRQVVQKIFQDFTQKLLPMSVNLIIGLVVINVGYLMYQPLRDGLWRALQARGTSERGRNLIVRLSQISYWILVIVTALTIVAPDVLSKFVLSLSLLSAAITVATRDTAADLVYGFALQVSPRVRIGDKIKVIGAEGAEGEVVEITFFYTVLKTEDGFVTICSKDLWNKVVKVVKPHLIAPGDTSADQSL